MIAAHLASTTVTSMSSFAKTEAHGWKVAISGLSRAIGDSRNALDSIFLHYLYSASCLGRWTTPGIGRFFRSTANLATVIIQEHFAAALSC